MSTRAQHQPVRLTKTYVDALKPPLKNQSFIRDGELKGFGVRVTANGAKAFILEKRINGRVRRQTIGRYPDLTVEQARKQAQVLLGQIAQGIDPVAEKEAARARQINLADAFADFKRARKGLKPRTLYDYERVMAVAFPDWQARPLLEISKEMVQRRHAKLGTERGPAYANLAMRFLRSLFNFALERYEDRQGRSVLHENPVDRLTRTRAWYRVQRRRTVIKAHELPAWYRGVSALRAGTGAGPTGNRNGKGAVTGAGPVTEPLPARSGPEATGEDIADYLELLLFTGLRRQEAATLTWDQVDLKERSLTIPDPKNHEPLVLPLSDYVYALLKRRREHARAKSPYVFPGTGKQGHLVEPKRAINKVKAVSALDFTLHDLRRTFVSTAESLDIAPYAIKRLVNHKMTNDVTAGYIVSDLERLRKPMQKVTDFLLRAMGVTESAHIIDLTERNAQ